MKGNHILTVFIGYMPLFYFNGNDKYDNNYRIISLFAVNGENVLFMKFRHFLKLFSLKLQNIIKNVAFYPLQIK